MKKGKRGQAVLLTLLLCALALFLYSGYVLADYWLESRNQQQMHKELIELTQLPEEPPEAAPEIQPETLPAHVSVTDPKTGEERLILREYAALYQRNPDLVGWIEIPGTEVNYPVVQSRAKDYYLRRDFDKKWANHGTVYVWEQDNVFTPSDNVTLFGHRMSDGTMFYDLLRYAKKEFWSSHPTFRFSTLEEHHEYEIVAAFRTSGTGGEGFAYHSFVNAANPEEFNSFVSQCKALSLYDTGITAQYGNKLVTLSTCDYTFDNGRMVVVGKRID